MINFYTAEVGVDLIFPLQDFSGVPLTAAPEAGYPRLVVEGLAISPVTLLATPTPGTYHHVVQAGQWPVGAGEVIHYYECYIEWRGVDGQVVLSDAFEIAVVKAPSTSLE